VNSSSRTGGGERGGGRKGGGGGVRHLNNCPQPYLKNDNENPDPYIPRTFQPFLDAFAKCA